MIRNQTLIAVILVGLAASASAGPLYFTCLAIHCAFGAACPLGVLNCIALMWCFDEDTTVIDEHGHEVLLRNTREGDVVKTFDSNGNEAWTKVVAHRKLR
jgi:hypothetical protein